MSWPLITIFYSFTRSVAFLYFSFFYLFFFQGKRGRWLRCCCWSFIFFLSLSILIIFFLKYFVSVLAWIFVFDFFFFVLFYSFHYIPVNARQFFASSLVYFFFLEKVFRLFRTVQKARHIQILHKTYTTSNKCIYIMLVQK